MLPQLGAFACAASALWVRRAVPVAAAAAAGRPAAGVRRCRRGARARTCRRGAARACARLRCCPVPPLLSA